jgi:hypothetical protein
MNIETIMTTISERRHLVKTICQPALASRPMMM